MTEPRLCTLYKLSVRLRLAASWLKDEADEGRIPCLRVGRRLYFNAAAVEATLAERAGRCTPNAALTRLAVTQ